LIPGPLNDATYGATFHLFLLRVDERIRGGIQAMKKELTAAGVTQIPHFCPLYHYKIFEAFGYDQKAIRASCPNTEAVFFNEYTHLPLYGLSEEQIEYMASAITVAAGKLSGK
jgi:dTDP-4-amino-4,6-dideoxygalactose transaminase